eukprot:6192654-Pleurochrysis_carterae.AAC.1
MMREARNRVEREQKGARKATRTRKAGVSLSSALEPSLCSKPILRMRQEAFTELEDCGGATPWLEHSFTGGIAAAELLGEAR